MCILRSGQWSFTYTFQTRKTTLCITSIIHRLYLIAVSIARFVMRMDIVHAHTHTVEL